jgi:predicted nucleic acid-binding protein
MRRPSNSSWTPSAASSTTTSSAEFLPLCRSRGVDVAGAIELVEELLNNDEVEVYWIDETLHRAAVHLLKARPDKTYSLCDAVSFVLMRQLDIGEALTTDKHFEQEGFERLLGSE